MTSTDDLAPVDVIRRAQEICRSERDRTMVSTRDAHALAQCLLDMTAALHEGAHLVLACEGLPGDQRPAAAATFAVALVELGIMTITEDTECPIQ